MVWCENLLPQVLEMLEGPRKETFPPGLRARGKVGFVWILWSL